MRRRKSLGFRLRRKLKQAIKRRTKLIWVKKPNFRR